MSIVCRLKDSLSYRYCHGYTRKQSRIVLRFYEIVTHRGEFVILIRNVSATNTQIKQHSNADSPDQAYHRHTYPPLTFEMTLLY